MGQLKEVEAIARACHYEMKERNGHGMVVWYGMVEVCEGAPGTVPASANTEIPKAGLGSFRDHLHLCL